jgi:hypothetical protein
MPKMAHGEWDLYGFQFWNQHKQLYGVKAEVAVATQRTPFPIGVSVVPAGWHDLSIARRAGGVFSRMAPGERALGDPAYVGEPDRVYAPPRRNADAYVEELDKMELTLQRRVEMANRHYKQFKTLGTTFRKGAVRAFPDLSIIVIVVAKLVCIDMLLNQEHSGFIHMTGPKKVQRDRRLLVPQMNVQGKRGKLRPQFLRERIFNSHNAFRSKQRSVRRR